MQRLLRLKKDSDGCVFLQLSSGEGLSCSINITEQKGQLVKKAVEEFVKPLGDITDYALRYKFQREFSPPSVLQEWVHGLALMKQSVLITACRGPDGLPKNHIAKVFCRYMRRCFLIRAFEHDACWNPYEERGGSFTGPCTMNNVAAAGGVVTNTHIVWPHSEADSSKRTAGKKPLLDAAMDQYLSSVDEVPHHFHLHLMHAAQLLGAYHPDKDVSDWWQYCYLKIVNDAHLQPESIQDMERRLSGNEKDWRDAEQITAK